MSHNLSYEEKRLKESWERVSGHLREDLANVWTDEARKEFDNLDSEAKRIAFILKWLRSRHYIGSVEYRGKLEDILAFSHHINHIEAKEKWVKTIHDDIVQIIQDIEETLSRVGGISQSRRTFVRKMGGVAIGLALGHSIQSYLKPDAASQAPPQIRGQFENVTLGAIRSVVNRNGGSGTEVLDNTEELLKNVSGVDLALTPEFSFYDSRNPIELQKSAGIYSVKNQENRYINRAKLLAQQYKTTLLLGTFAEKKNEDDVCNTLLQINQDGVIVARKRKYHALEDQHVLIAKNGKTYYILPVVCGEISNTTFLDSVSSSNHKYDIIAYSAHMGDVSFSYLTDFIQNNSDEKSKISKKNRDYLDWTRDAYEHYFGKFKEALNPGAKIIVADGAFKNSGTVSDFNLDPLPFYTPSENYLVAKF